MDKKRIFSILLIGIPSLVVCLLLLCAIMLNTAAFRNFLRSEISKQALERAGVRVEMESIETHWTHLGADLNNLVVYGASSPSANEPALLQASRLAVGLRFLPLLRGRFELRQLIFERPIVNLRIDSQGRSNLPAVSQTGSTNGPGTVFDLEVESFAIHSGEIYYNDAQIPLDAELHGLKFNAGYSLLTAAYQGSLSYDHGRLAAREFEPVVHAMQLQFTASRSGLTLSPLIISSDASRLTVNAQLANYASPSIAGTYQGNVSTSELAHVLRSPSMPRGDVALAGKLAYQPNPQRSFLAAVNVQGQASSDKLQFRTSQQAIDATDVSANYVLKNATLQVQNLAANILGGHAQANWQMQHIDAPRALARLDASVKGVSLSIASDALAPRKMQSIPFVGTSDIEVHAAWSGSLESAVANARLAVSSPQQTISSQSIPVNGLVQVDYNGPQNTLAFRQSYLQTGNTKLTVNGNLSSRRGGNSLLLVDASASDLREVRSLAAMVQAVFQPSQPAAKIPGLAGSAVLNARITGTARDPHAQVRLNAQNLAIDGSQWRSLAMDVSADSSELTIQNGASQGDRKRTNQFRRKGRTAGLVARGEQLHRTAGIHCKHACVDRRRNRAIALSCDRHTFGKSLS